MGEFADYALDEVFEEEFHRDEFANGYMSAEDAFERGYLDPVGATTGFADYSPDRVQISSYESLTVEIEHWQRVLQPVADSTGMTLTETCALKSKYPHLNNEAFANLFKENPTCNCCRTSMKMRTGKYGDFYFCPNQCKSQKTVSKSYWDSVRIIP